MPGWRALPPCSELADRFEGCGTTAELFDRFQAGGWQLRARWRSSIASFGLGASLHLPERGWCQVALALPMRTGFLDAQGQERLTLLPHCALELELSRGDDQLLVQWYQGTEGLCGWEPLNDQPRPWQNDRANGTVRYADAIRSEPELARLARLTEVVALVHNRLASSRQLLLGGYGPLGLCIDSVALLQQALSAIAIPSTATAMTNTRIKTKVTMNRLLLRRRHHRHHRRHRPRPRPRLTRMTTAMRCRRRSMTTVPTRSCRN